MPDLTAPAATTTPIDGKPRFEQGEQVTILITATVDSEWDAASFGGGTHLMVGVRLPGGRELDLPADYPGIRVIHGDITPTLLAALPDAISYHDEGACGIPEHEDWVNQYERAIDALDPQPTLVPVPD